ncbi:RimK/LysX family protein [Curtobacterium flaccumfaciens]|uniref:RimK/LysX family protein n=1 Tax=Curtobacterium poinsettiae TaxID=159612 RepID=A0A9Q9P8H2_9MICO|nr:RimK/LysX family protein [Curtobacterium flaccumfaciens]UXN25936.1 RimK/LysX family protein [Curtobacterium flaccumfaciens]UYC80777.1 RimK/LysX family protein [Curtobacterium flaccumfaciens pv. poinsettiae]
MARAPKSSDSGLVVAGWREWAGLPDLGVPWIKVKLDTGARSSALHAFDLEELPGERVRFSLHPWQDTDADASTIECDVHDRRIVRSSTGHTQERIVVRTRIALAGQVVESEVTLSNRDQMGFRMLVGREALRQGFLVDPGRSFMAGRAPKEIRRRNRGRA